MQALWIEAGELSWRDDVPVPAPAAGEVLIRVRRAGICHTDLELQRGYYSFAGIPGHEFVGDVVGGRSAAWEGRRVVGEINAACHACDLCRRGWHNHCRRRTVLGILGRHGAFAEYLCLPQENLHEVPAQISDDEAVFVEPLAAALQIQRQLDLDSDDRVAILGDGKLGLLVAQTLHRSGAQVLLVGRHDAKLSVASARGIAVGHEPPEQGTWDVAVDCTGSAAGFAIACACLRPRGTLVLKSTYAGRLQLDAARLVVDEIHVLGSRCGPFAPALALIRQGGVDLASLIHARYPLATGVAAFAHAAGPGVLKVLIDVH